jgi:glutamate:Na+ symporter, ESS family
MSALSLVVLLAVVLASLALQTRGRFFAIIPLSLLVAIGIVGIDQVAPSQVSLLVSGWEALPEIFITIVFATLFFGKPLVGLKKMWRFAGPQIVLSQTFAWGQYVVGSLMAIFVLVPIFNMSPMSAALIEISFEGGHGTAAGLGPLFEEVGFSDGADLALGLATIGLVSGIISGVIMVAVFKVKNPKFQTSAEVKPSRIEALRGQFLLPARLPVVVSQLALVGLAIGLGLVIKQLLSAVETLARIAIPALPEVMTFIPLFPLAMIGGIIIQYLAQKLGFDNRIDSPTMARLGAISLEVVILSAIATISLSAIGQNLLPFILLAAVGLAWNIAVVLLLAPRIFSEFWFQRAIPDFGQSTGTTASGLMLLRSADPTDESGSLERFGYTALLFEPIVGGGIFTSSSLLIIAYGGNWLLLGITGALLVTWLAIGLRFFYRKPIAKTS